MDSAKYLELTEGLTFYTDDEYDMFRGFAANNVRDGRTWYPYIEAREDNLGPRLKIGREIRHHGGGELIAVGNIIYMSWPAPAETT